MASTVRGAETQTALTARLPLPLPGTRDDMKGRCAATLRRATETSSNIHEKTRPFFVSVCRAHPGRDCVHFHIQMVEAQKQYECNIHSARGPLDPFTQSSKDRHLSTTHSHQLTTDEKTESQCGKHCGHTDRGVPAARPGRRTGSRIPKVVSSTQHVVFLCWFFALYTVARLRAALTIIHTDGRDAPHRASADGAS